MANYGLKLDSQHFNSHAHVERDDQDGKVYIDYLISTHTLTWSVTQLRLLSLL